MHAVASNEQQTTSTVSAPHSYLHTCNGPHSNTASYVRTYNHTHEYTRVVVVDADLRASTHQVRQGHLSGHLIKVKVPAHETDHKEGAEEEGALGGQLRALLVA